MKKKTIALLSIAVIILGIVAVALITGNIVGGKLMGKEENKTVMAEKTVDETIQEATKDATAEQSAQDTSKQDSTTQQASTAKPETTDNIVKNDDKNSANSESAGAKEIKKVKVKAIYLSGMSAGSEKVLNKYIDIINTTELNAVVIDVKESGVVNYKSAVPVVEQNKLYAKNFDPDKVLKKLHDNNIYVIARIVCFRDNGLATKIPELAVKRTNGTAWTEGKLGAWTNPYKEETWDYNIEIAKEAVEKGFDEIQFDYVRFPTASKKDVNYGTPAMTKGEAIAGFLKKAGEVLHNGMGVPVSADVFGIIAECSNDAKSIGQELAKVGMNIDYISPMVYPSHYSNAAKKGFLANGAGQTVNGVLFTAPDLKPYEVVYNTLLGIKKEIAKVDGYKADVRPYLQDFTATYLPKGYYQEYGAEQVKQQIKAVYDAGYEQWILWDGRNTYSEGAFDKE